MIKTKLQFVFGFLFFCYTSFGQVDHWESVVLEGDTWSYHVPSSQLTESWTQAGFDDSGWQEGPSGIGYGDDDDGTVINQTISLYMRRVFSVVTIDEIDSVLLDMDYDDGFVAYLNGTEIARSLMSGSPPAFDQSADGLHEAQLYNGGYPERFAVSKDLLVQGENVLAVEVHNDNIGSSDMSSIPFLSLGINTTNTHYQPVPDWFEEPVYTVEIDLESSNLPIVLIETNGGSPIPDEPKIGATMTIIDNGDGIRNFVTDASNPESLDYDGAIQIEIRGSSSRCCSPKKQYALTTYDDAGEKDNVSLLGMPKENDWILNAFAFDPSLMRDYISYQLSLRIGQYASRGVYCEVVLNGTYLGVYVLQEKLKADDNRIDINKIGENDIEGDDLTGGYITKADKTEGTDVPSWYMESAAFVHEHPKPTTVTPEQDEYIRNYFFDLDLAVNVHNPSVTIGYPSLIDLPSFVDFMIINEIGSNADAYQFSTFFHKDKNAKLRAGPVWDFNLTYGNDIDFWNLDRSHTDVWQFANGDNEGPRFWKDLYTDQVFNCYLSKRWSELTQPGQPLHPDQIHQLIDEVVSHISEGAERDNLTWGTLGDYPAHIADMKQWITERVAWMSGQLGDGTGCSGEEVPELVISKINYHPMTADGSGEKDLEFIEITNVGSEPADLTGVYFGGTGLVYQFPANTDLDPGSSVYLANESTAFRIAYGFDPFDEFNRSLNNGGQRIELLNGYGNLIDEVEYLDVAPWPVEADGEGYYLNLVDLQLDNNDPSNWEAVQLEIQILSASGPDPMITLFPNPANRNVRVQAQSPILALRIVDLQGREVAIQNPDNPVTDIDISGLDKGIYLIEIQTSKKSYSRKLIVE
jgi:hypothetical protein